VESAAGVHENADAIRVDVSDLPPVQLDARHARIIEQRRKYLFQDGTGVAIEIAVYL
jgi:hypothetical protein